MSDPVNPSYYDFNGIQLNRITGELTGNGSQAAQYVVRSTRMDGDLKNADIDGRIQDLHKAKWFIDAEVVRLERLRDA